MYIKSETKNICIWLIVMLCTLWLFTMVWTKRPMLFMTNDDAGILYALSGLDYTEPIPEHPFVLPLFAIVVSSLYRLFPSVNWYVVFHTGTLIFSWGIIAKYALQESLKSKRIYRIVYFVVLFALFGFTSILKLSFSITPAVAGTAAIVLKMNAKGDGLRKRVFVEIIAILLMTLCINWRYSTGLCILCFYLWQEACSFFDRLKKKEFKKIGIQIGSLLLLILIVLGSKMLQKNEDNEKSDLYAFNSAKSSYMDYAHTGYDANPEIYEKIGISRPLFELIHNWFCLDEKISTENFEYLSEETKIESNERNSDVFKQAWYQIKNFYLKSSIYVRISAIVPFVMAVLVLGILIRTNKKELIFTLGVLAGTMILFLYLGIKGRVNYRAFAVIMIPSSVMVMLSYLKAEKNLVINKVRTTIGILVAVLLLSGSVLYTYQSVQSIRYGDAQTAMKIEKQIIRYAKQHDDCYYAYDYNCLNRKNPLVYSEEYITDNMISIGRNPYDVRSLKIAEELGVERVSGDSFLLENFFFITTKNSNMKDLVFEWLQTEYGATGYEVVDTLYGDYILIVHYYK